MSAAVDQKFPSGGTCHPRFPMPRKVLEVFDPVQVDLSGLPGCRFWNCSRFWKKRPEDWHVEVRFCRVAAVAVVGSIATPWRNDGNRSDVARIDIGLKTTANTEKQKEKQLSDFVGVLSLAPATKNLEISNSESGQKLLGRLSVFLWSEVGVPLLRCQ